MTISPFGWQDNSAPWIDAENLEAQHAAAGAYVDAQVAAEQARAEAAEAALQTEIQQSTGSSAGTRSIITVKGAVVVSAQALGNYSGVPGSTIDGQTFGVGDVILLTAESNSVNNGPWVIQTGQWTRPTSFASGSSWQGVVCFITGAGSSNQGSLFGLLGTGVIDSNTQIWHELTRDLNDRGFINAYSVYNRNDVVTIPSIEARVLVNQPTQATVNGTLPGGTYVTLERLRIWDPVKDFGAQAGGDITVALQNAIYAAANSGAYSTTPGQGTSAVGIGGIVEIPDGFFTFGSQNANAAATAQNAAIDVPSNVWIRGRGWSATYLQLNYNSNCHGFAMHRSTGSGNSNAFWSQISSLTIDGRSGHQGTTLSDCTVIPGSAVVTSAAGTFPANGTVVNGIGIPSGTTILSGGGTGTVTLSQSVTLAGLQWTPGATVVNCGGALDAQNNPVPWAAIYHETNPYSSAQTGDNQFDPTHLFADLRIYSWQGDGVKIHGRSDCTIRHVKATQCTGNSFTVDFDTMLIECISEFAHQNALEIPGHSSDRVVGCKFYNSYERGIKITGASASEIAIEGIDLQQNNLESLYIASGGTVRFSGTISETGFNNTLSQDPVISSAAWSASASYKNWRTSGGAIFYGGFNSGYFYAVYTAGTSGSSTPTWPTTLGSTVTDGGVTWVCVGTPTSTLIPADVSLTSSAARCLIDATCNKSLAALRITNGCTGNDIRLTQESNGGSGAVQLTPESLAPLSSGNNVQINGTNLSVPKAAYLTLFGDGSNGTLVFDGTSIVASLTPSGGVYNMNKDIYATNLTINSGVTVVMNGWRIFATGTVTNNGTIAMGGGAGNANGTAASATAAGLYGGGGAGGAGNTGAGSQAPSVNCLGAGSGGPGGTGSSGAGGSERFAIYGSTTIFRVPTAAENGMAVYQGIVYGMAGGCGGSGGGGDGTNKGGGGGSGGGVIVIFAATIINNGSISAPGGTGGTPTTGNCGGGGGGGGGLILLYTLNGVSGTGTFTAPGGSGGAGVGTGTAGTNGVSGNYASFLVV